MTRETETERTEPFYYYELPFLLKSIIFDKMDLDELKEVVSTEKSADVKLWNLFPNLVEEAELIRL